MHGSRVRTTVFWDRVVIHDEQNNQPFPCGGLLRYVCGCAQANIRMATALSWITILGILTLIEGKLWTKLTVDPLTGVESNNKWRGSNHAERRPKLHNFWMVCYCWNVQVNTRAVLLIYGVLPGMWNMRQYLGMHVRSQVLALSWIHTLRSNQVATNVMTHITLIS